MTENEDYIGPDGLVHCGRCRTPKQRWGVPGNPERVMWCACQCELQRRHEEVELLERENRAHQRQRRRRENIPNLLLRGFTFETAVQTLRQKPLQGRGREHGAAALGRSRLRKDLRRGVHRELCRRAWGHHPGDLPAPNKRRFPGREAGLPGETRRLRPAGPGRPGTERDTSTANETTFQVVNTRYESRKPMLITTNLSPEQMHSPATQHQARIYDRVLEVCTAVYCGKDFMRENMEKMKEILRGE